MYNPVTKLKSKIRSVSPWAVIIGTPILAAILFNAPASAQQVKSTSMFENPTISPNFSPDPLTITGIGGGTVPSQKVAGRAETATGSCVGFVDAKPDHKIVLTNFFKNLTIQVESPEDMTLLIKGPGGSWCNDDYNGKNPGISGQWLEGNYNVWVGSYQKNKSTPYIIRLTEK